MQRSGYWLAAGAAALALCIGSGGKALLAEETPPTAPRTTKADSPNERFYIEKMAKIDGADPTPETTEHYRSLLQRVATKSSESIRFVADSAIAVHKQVMRAGKRESCLEALQDLEQAYDEYGTASRYKMTVVRSWVSHEVIRRQKQGESGRVQSGPASHL